MSNSHLPTSENPRRGDRALGLPFVAILGLALLALPRVVLHDLGALTEGTVVNGLFVVVPLVIWIVVVLWQKVPNPFLTLVVVGAIYGVLLALGHQILWNVGYDGHAPRLGGNLADLDRTVQSAIIRTFAAVSSIFTGVIVGVVTGGVAWALRLMTRMRERASAP